MAGPGPVPEEAQAYFRQKGWKVSFDWRDTWRQEHAAAFTVAKAMRFDVLSTIRFEVDRAIRDGLTLDQFKKELTPRLQRLGWWGRKDMVDPATGAKVDAQLGSPRRLKTIYRANLRTARAAGQWDRAQRTKRALPYFKYLLGPSEEHREEHVALAGTILPVDAPFWDTHFPPNGWGCKCHVRQITQREADRSGGVSQTPQIPTTTWRNKRTGKVERLPQGIDPGWDTNAGKARFQAVDKSLAEKEADWNATFPADPIPERKGGVLGPEAWERSLTGAERDAAYRWTEDSGPIRRYMLTGEGDERTRRHAELLTGALARSKPTKRTVYRGLSGLSDGDWDKIIGTRQLSDAAIHSVSSSKDVALGYSAAKPSGKNLLVEYQSRRSVDIRGVTTTGEDELIQRPGLFKVIDSRPETLIIDGVQRQITILRVFEP